MKNSLHVPYDRFVMGQPGSTESCQGMIDLKEYKLIPDTPYKFNFSYKNEKH